MKNKVVLDENKICDMYKNGRDGIETIAKLFHVGKFRIKEILIKNNISFKKRGKQELNEKFVVNDYKIEKYPQIEGYYYVAIDKNNGFTTKDFMNNAGVLTTHIKSNYGVEPPTLYYRRKYYMQTGNYWWEQWFDIKSQKKIKAKKCPYCEWETIDISNKSGWFEQHLLKAHGISPSEHLEKYPNDINYFSGYVKEKKRNERLLKNDEYVVCPLCNQRFNKLTKISARKPTTSVVG